QHNSLHRSSLCGSRDATAARPRSQRARLSSVAQIFSVKGCQSRGEDQRLRLQLRRLLSAKPAAPGPRAVELGVVDLGADAQCRIEAENAAELAAEGEPVDDACSTGVPDSFELALADFGQHRRNAEREAGRYELVLEEAHRLPSAKSADQPGS